MICSGITSFICIFVAVVTATDVNKPDSISGSDPQITIYRLRTGKPNSPPVEQPQEVKETGAVLQESPTEPRVAATGGEGASPTTQLRSSHRRHSRAPASSATPSAECHLPPSDDPAVLVLQKLSVEEKGKRLIKAAEERTVQELQSLLAAGADVGAKDKSGRTALHHAAMKGPVEAVRCLLVAGADVGARDVLQMVPLHWAAYWGHADAVRLLVAASSDPNIRNAWGYTPLHFAAYSGQAEAAAALLQLGADKGARNNDGEIPLDLARQQSQQQLIDILA